jgi:hypothetical protein
MRREVAVVIVLGACYAPTIENGIPCSQQRDCPQGQVCAANDRCELPGRDARDVDVAPDAPLATWAKPQPLTTINTPSLETDPTITADGLVLVFSSNRPGGAGLTDLYQATRAKVTDSFDAAVRLAEVSSADADNASDLSADGLTIYLRISGDIYTARRMTRTALFDTPTFEPMLSTAAFETNPAISRDGLAFTVTREAGLVRDLFLFERDSLFATWGLARELTEISTSVRDSGGAFGQTALVIFWHTDRDATGFADLYTAWRPNKNQPFRDAAPIAELNTAAAGDTDPSVTADLRYIVFECSSDLCFSTR